MIGNKLEPFKFWCQKVLPNVYDDSLSYYEYLCKLNEYLNEVIGQINTLTDNMEDYESDLNAQWTAYKNDLNAEWTETKNYIDNYFNNLDVQNEINNKLDQMASSGALSTLLAPIVGTQIGGVVAQQIGGTVANQIDGAVALQIDGSVAGQIGSVAPSIVTQWLNENVTPVGSAVVVDNSLSISGAAADAKVTGDIIKNNSTLITTSDLSIQRKFIFPSTGEIRSIANDNFFVSDFIELDENANKVYICGKITTNESGASVAFYRTNDWTTFISSVVLDGNEVYVNIPDKAHYVVFASNTTNIGILKETDIIFRAIIKSPNSVKQNDAPSNYILTSRTIDLESQFIDDYYIRPTTGAKIPIAVDDFKITDFIELNDSDSVILSNATNIVTNGTASLLAYYKNNDYNSFISAVTFDGQTLYSKIPDNAKYVIIGSNTTPSGKYKPLNDKLKIMGVKNRSIINSVNNGKIICDDTYNLIVNDTFELFYKGIIDKWNNDDYYVMADCSKGSNFKDKFVITPTVAETLTLTLTLYDSFNVINDVKTISLKINATPSSPNTGTNILCVGDSLTTNGEWVSEFKRRLTESGGTPTGYNLSNVYFVGTCEKLNANFEGYGGWTINNYNTASSSASFKMITCSHDKTEAEDQHSIYKDANNNQWKIETVYSNSIKIILTNGNANNFPATGTLTWVSGGVHHSNIVYTASENAPGNPFWDITENKVDFASYCSRLNITKLDYILVLIGWNSANTQEATYKSQVQTFIDNVQADYPNAKIIFMGLEIPSLDGLGVNYGAVGAYSKYITLMNFVHNLDKWYEDIASENTNVYHMNISAQFDTKHNMPQSTRAVNTRNSETEVYQTNGIHPALSGYNQIADAATRVFVNLM